MRRRSLAAGAVLCAAVVVLVSVLVLHRPGGSGELPASVAGDAVREMVRQAERSTPYDALLLLGDLVYEEGDVERIDDVVTRPFAALLDSGTALVPVLGNHDYASGEQAKIMASLGGGATWYVARVGALRIIVLDTERTNDLRQTNWLRATLAAPQQPGTWTVVAMHKPAYSAGYHGSDAAVRARWVPLFEQYDVPLVLAGHDHDYQRSKPINDVTYVVSGAGAKLRPTGHADFTAVSMSRLHFLDMLVYPDRIKLRAVDHSGKLVDRFSIAR